MTNEIQTFEELEASLNYVLYTFERQPSKIALLVGGYNRALTKQPREQVNQIIQDYVNDFFERGEGWDQGYQEIKELTGIAPNNLRVIQTKYNERIGHGWVEGVRSLEKLTNVKPVFTTKSVDSGYAHIFVDGFGYMPQVQDYSQIKTTTGISPSDTAMISIYTKMLEKASDLKMNVEDIAKVKSCTKVKPSFDRKTRTNFLQTCLVHGEFQQIRELERLIEEEISFQEIASPAINRLKENRQKYFEKPNPLLYQVPKDKRELVSERKYWFDRLRKLKSFYEGR